MVNTWRGLPFYGITLLAGLQTISPDLYEAAAIDGASVSQRFWHITMPVLKPILIIVTMFSVIFTFSDFQLLYVLTHGGPANATHLFATYAFDIGMSAGQLGMGAAVALTMLPRARPADRRPDPLPPARVMVGGRGLGGRTLRLYLPLAFFLVAMLFPFYWMAITSIKPNRELYSQRDHAARSSTSRRSSTTSTSSTRRTSSRGRTTRCWWPWSPPHLARARRDDRLPAGPHELPGRRRGGHRGGRDVPGPAAAALHPDGRHHQPPGPRQHAQGRHADLSHAAHPVLRLAAHGLLQERAARAGGGGAHRRGQPASRP